MWKHKETGEVVSLVGMDNDAVYATESGEEKTCLAFEFCRDFEAVELEPPKEAKAPKKKGVFG